MKARETVVRLRKFDVEEKQRKADDIEMMIAEFERMAHDLDQQIEAEEARSGVRDRDHFSYPPFANAAAQRRDNLLTSVEDLRIKFGVANGELEDALDLLRKAEQREERRQDAAVSSDKTVADNAVSAPRSA